MMEECNHKSGSEDGVCNGCGYSFEHLFNQLRADNEALRSAQPAGECGELVEEVRDAIRQAELQNQQNIDLGFELVDEGFALPLLRKCLAALSRPQSGVWVSRECAEGCLATACIEDQPEVEELEQALSRQGGPMTDKLIEDIDKATSDMSELDYHGHSDDIRYLCGLLRQCSGRLERADSLARDGDERLRQRNDIIVDLRSQLGECRDRMRWVPVSEDVEAIRKACGMVNNALAVKVNHVDVGGVAHVQIPRREFMAVHDGLHFARNALSALSQPPRQEQQEQQEQSES